MTTNIVGMFTDGLDKLALGLLEFFPFMLFKTSLNISRIIPILSKFPQTIFAFGSFEVLDVPRLHQISPSPVQMNPSIVGRCITRHGKASVIRALVVIAAIDHSHISSAHKEG